MRFTGPRPAYALGILCLIGRAAAFAAPSTSAPPPETSFIPQAIRVTLNQEYPGWKLAPCSTSVRQLFAKEHIGHPPNVIWGDFNQDGQRDYGVQIALTDPDKQEQIAIAFLAKPEGYDEVILESRGLDPDVYLWTLRRTDSVQEGTAEKPAARDLFVVKGGPAGESVYGYEAGGFHEQPGDELPSTPPAE